MNPYQLRRLLPQASASCIAANAKDYGTGLPEPVEPRQRVLTPGTGKAPSRTHGKRRRAMNKTEAAFTRILNAKIDSGEILSWHYEGATLRWGTMDSIAYTADFLAILPDNTIRFYETKGSKLFKDTNQKFKAARNQWPRFKFEMWQLKKGTWQQLY